MGVNLSYQLNNQNLKAIENNWLARKASKLKSNWFSQPADKASQSRIWFEVACVALIEAALMLLVLGTSNRAEEPRFVLFLPFGFALFALIKRGPKMLFGVFAGGFLARMQIFEVPLHAFLATSIFTIGVALGYLTLLKLKFDGYLKGSKQLARLIAASLVTCAFNLVVSCATAMSLGLIESHTYSYFQFAVNELGNFSALVIVTSLLILWTQPEKVQKLQNVSLVTKLIRISIAIAAILFSHHAFQLHSWVNEGSVIDLSFVFLVITVGYFWGARTALIAATVHLVLHGSVSLTQPKIYTFLPDQGQSLINPLLQTSIIDIAVVLFMLTLELHLREQESIAEAALNAEKAKNAVLTRNKDMIRSFGHEFGSPLYVLEAFVKEARESRHSDLLAGSMQAKEQINRMKRVCAQLQTHHSLTNGSELVSIQRVLSFEELNSVICDHLAQFDPLERLQHEMARPRNFSMLEAPVSNLLSVVEELARNGLDHSHPDMADVHVTTKFYMADKTPHVEVKVTNSISEQAVQMIRTRHGYGSCGGDFSSEWRVSVDKEQVFSDSDHRGKNNLGLGLSIAQEIATQLGGKLVLSVNCAEKTYTARFFLPMRAAQTADDEVKQLASEHLPTVYIVDDCPLNLKLAQVRVAKLKVKVVAFSDPKAAVSEIIQNATPNDLVLMGLQMPEVSGYEATKLIRMAKPELKLPILAYTASSELECAAALVTYGLDGYLSKMQSTDHILAVVARTMSLPNPIRQIA